VQINRSLSPKIATLKHIVLGESLSCTWGIAPANGVERYKIGSAKGDTYAQAIGLARAALAKAVEDVRAAVAMHSAAHAKRAALIARAGGVA
jgi:hypothetical protein